MYNMLSQARPKFVFAAMLLGWAPLAAEADLYTDQPVPHSNQDHVDPPGIIDQFPHITPGDDLGDGLSNETGQQSGSPFDGPRLGGPDDIDPSDLERAILDEIDIGGDTGSEPLTDWRKGFDPAAPFFLPGSFDRFGPRFDDGFPRPPLPNGGVPEPATAMLILAAGAMLLSRRR